MAKFIGVFLFLFLFLSISLVSHARIDSDFSDVAEDLPISTLPENDQKTELIHLPTEEKGIIKSDPVTSAASEAGLLEAVGVTSFRPFKFNHDFRPVNRRFGRRCGHHHDFRHRGEHQLQIHGSNDMIDFEKPRIPNRKDMMDFDKPTFHFEEERHRIPNRKDMMDFDKPRFHFEEERHQIPYGDDMVDFKKPRIPNRKDIMHFDKPRFHFEEEKHQIPYGDDMIFEHGDHFPSEKHEFRGDWRADHDEEHSGFMSWFQNIINRF